MSVYKYSDFDTINCFYADVKYDDKDEAKTLGARWNPIIKKWYFNSKRIRHDWDMHHSDYISDEAKDIEEFTFYNDIFYTIYHMLNDKNGPVQHYSTYENLVNYLIQKYGPVPADYFDENWNQNWKQNSRTSEGLEIHHIDEDKYLFLSDRASCERQNVPFECQRAERLVYCNKIEHLLLHIRIAEDFHADDLQTYYKFGIKTLISKINDYYEFDELPGDWRNGMITAINNLMADYIVLLIYISTHLIYDNNMLFDNIENIVISSREGQHCTHIINAFNGITTILNKRYDIEYRYLTDVFK